MDGRVFGAVVAAALLAGLAALVLGEYEFTGVLPFVAGPVLGLLVGEVLVSIGRRRDPVIGLTGATATAAALVVAGWLDANQGVEPIASGAWVAAGLGAACALWRGWGRVSTPGRC